VRGEYVNEGTVSRTERFCEELFLKSYQKDQGKIFDAKGGSRGSFNGFRSVIIIADFQILWQVGDRSKVPASVDV